MPLDLFPLLFEQGAMPFTKSIWHKLWSSELDVLLPFTLSSWATISTGVNPGKHGIFDFIDVTDLKLVTRDKLEYPYINDIVAFNGLKAIAINVPLAYPPFVKRNNIVISSWTEPKLATWPPDEIKTVKKYATTTPHKPNTLDEYIDTLADSLENRIGLIEEYYLYRDWNLFYTVVPETDWLFHYLYGNIVKRDKLGKKALKLFKTLDKLIKTIFQNMPDNTLLLMCSDHGFAEAHKSLNINVLLKQEGLLETRESQLPLKTRLVLKLARVVPHYVKSKLKYTSMIFIFKKAGVFDVFTTNNNPIDYEKSVAFATIAYNLYINRKLPINERRRIRTELITALTKFKELLEKIEYGEKYFWGPYIERAPDILLLPRKGYNISTRLFYKSVIEEGKWFVHSNKGFIAIYAQNDANLAIGTGTLKSTTIVPTVLSYLNLPIDPYMDGKPLIKPIRRDKRAYNHLARIAKTIMGISTR